MTAGGGPGAPPRRLLLATRGSALALAQADAAVRALRAAGAASPTAMVVRTRGDLNPTTPVEALSGQGWFTSELEAALVSGAADIAVHSAKDLPGELGAGLVIAAVLERADPRDALVSAAGRTLSELAAGARVGTSSPRRREMLLAERPDLVPVPIRGNVDTRLRKLAGGEVDALLLACAGLDRLGLGHRVTERLDPRRFVPAPAQGAIALEACAGSPAELAATAASHAASLRAVRAERAVLRHLGGGCLLPLGAWARDEGDALVVTAALAGEGRLRVVEVSGDRADPEAAGRAAAAALG